MKKGNIVQEKSYAFAVNNVAVCKKLMENEKEHILSKQLLRSGTSIGATFRILNVFPLNTPQPLSRGDFLFPSQILSKNQFKIKKTAILEQ